MARLTLQEFIEKTADGKIFGVTFVKRTDGTIREMTARRGVKKGVTGVGLAFNPKDYALLTVFDMQKAQLGPDGEILNEKGAFRMINLEALISLKLHGASYNFNAAEQVFVSQE